MRCLFLMEGRGSSSSPATSLSSGLLDWGGGLIQSGVTGGPGALEIVASGGRASLLVSNLSR